MSFWNNLWKTLWLITSVLLSRWGLWYLHRRDLETPVIPVDGAWVRPGEVFVDIAAEKELGDRLRELGGRPYEPAGDKNDWRQRPSAPDYGDVNARLDEAEIRRHLWVGFDTRRAVRLVRKRELRGVHFNVVYRAEGILGYYQGGPDGPPIPDSRPSKFPAYQGDGIVDVDVFDTGMPHEWMIKNPELKHTVDEVGTKDPVGSGGVVPASHGGHGLFICGLIARSQPTLNIRTYRVMEATGEVDESNVCAKIVLSDAKVVNLSFGGATPSGEMTPIMGDAVAQAVSKDKVVVAAAGNDKGHSDNSQERFWPAASSDVIAVGAFDSSTGDFASFTNRGDVYAPGVGLLSTYVTDWNDKDGAPYKGWAKWSGTSFATPVVAAEIADYLARNFPSGSSSRRDTAAVWLSGLGDSPWPGKPDLQVVLTKKGKIFRPTQVLTS